MPRHAQTSGRSTIKDVAREAGVSVSTVSNVLNGRTDAMTEETLLRIQKAINSLKFRPNSVARGLVTRRTVTIGVILSEIETPIFLQALSSIESIARTAGYNLLLTYARSVDDEHEALNLLLEKQVDGIIFFSTSEYRNDDHLIELFASGLPIVLINRATINPIWDQINWDNANGVTSAVEHLAQLGHRHIAHLRGPSKSHSSEERLRGYIRGLEQCGLDYRADYVQSGDYTQPAEIWRQSTQTLITLAPRPTAIIASADVVAAVAMKTLQDDGLLVPNDISTIGIDNETFCSYLNPSLTSIQLPVIEAGKIGMEILLNRITDPVRISKHIIIPCPLVKRESTGAPASYI